MTISREKEITMKNIILANAFSVQMLTKISDWGWGTPVTFTLLTLDNAKEILSNGFTSAIGHSDTATVVSDLLGMDVPTNRVSISLESDEDTLIIAQIMGGRLPEGSTTIPEGMEIRFVKAQILNLNNWAPL